MKNKSSYDYVKIGLGLRLLANITSNTKQSFVIGELNKLKDALDYIVYRAAGCEKCSGSGYSGRLVIAESFLSTEELEDMIIEGKKSVEIQSFLLSKGMIKLYKDGLFKAVEGYTTIREVEKAVLL